MAIPNHAQALPMGMRKALASGRNFRRRINAAHIPMYSMAIEPPVTAINQRKEPEIASTQSGAANMQIPNAGVRNLGCKRLKECGKSPSVRREGFVGQGKAQFPVLSFRINAWPAVRKVPSENA